VPERRNLFSICSHPPPDLPPKKPGASSRHHPKEVRRCQAMEKAGMTKEKYAEMLNLIPHEADADIEG
jgi:hypothetical protein